MPLIPLDKPAYKQLCDVYNKQDDYLAKQEVPLVDSNNPNEICYLAQLRTRRNLLQICILKTLKKAGVNIASDRITTPVRASMDQCLQTYQRIFPEMLPMPFSEVLPYIQEITKFSEASWYKDMRYLGFALHSFAQLSPHLRTLIANYQFRYTAVFRNSIILKGLKDQMGEDNSIAQIRRQQVEVFIQHANTQIDLQRTMYATTQSINYLQHASKICQAMIEMSVAVPEMLEIEHYKKHETAIQRSIQAHHGKE